MLLAITDDTADFAKLKPKSVEFLVFLTGIDEEPHYSITPGDVLTDDGILFICDDIDSVFSALVTAVRAVE